MLSMIIMIDEGEEWYVTKFTFVWRLKICRSSDCSSSSSSSSSSIYSSSNNNNSCYLFFCCYYYDCCMFLWKNSAVCEEVSVSALAADHSSNLRRPHIATDDTLLLLLVWSVVRAVLGRAEGQADDDQRRMSDSTTTYVVCTASADERLLQLSSSTQTNRQPLPPTVHLTVQSIVVRCPSKYLRHYRFLTVLVILCTGIPNIGLTGYQMIAFAQLR